MNNKILYGIIAVAFVGGMFTVAYAGPMLPMITFAANTHTTGNADIDGELNVDGFSTLNKNLILVNSDIFCTINGFDVIPCISGGLIYPDSISFIEIGTDTLGEIGLDCADNQVARKVGFGWECSTISSNIPPAITTVDSTGVLEEATSIAIGDDGFPVISFVAFTNSDLKVAKCNNTSCTGTSTITEVDSSGVVGQYSSIAIGDDGFPVISYYNILSGGELKVAKCVNTSCTGISTITVIDTAGDNGRHTSIAIGDDGFPVISYHDNTNGDLKVAKCVNAACTGTSTITPVDSTADDVGRFTSITIDIDGFPVISHRDLTNGDLKVAKCVNAACTGTSTNTTVDSTADDVGFDTSIAIGDDGFPVISYRDNTNDNLKVYKEYGIIFN